MSARKPRDTFSVTFELVEGDQVTSQATFTGPEWDQVYRWLCRLTPAAVDRLAAGQRLDRVSLDDLAYRTPPEPGARAFADVEQLNEFLGSQSPHRR